MFLALVAQFGKSGRLKPGRSQVQLLSRAQDNSISHVCSCSSMDRVPASGAGGCGFDSRRERAIKTCPCGSDGQSGSLLMNRSRVRVPPGARLPGAQVSGVLVEIVREYIES